MIKEVSDLYELLQSVHGTIDKMLEGLSEEDWVKKPREDFNNIASIVEHTALVERRFFTLLNGETPDIDASAPFKATSWNVSQVKALWTESLDYARSVLEGVSESALDQFAAKLGVGEVNKRQLITYAIAHAAHHRGQIPLVKKMLAN